jgi:hypothetical protein
MKFRLSINESDNKVIFQQQNYIDVQNDVINVRHSLSENVTYEFAYTGNIVQFQISLSGTYKIEAWGARGGGGSSSTGPLGAYSKSFVFLNKDERIKILVGEKGYPGYNAGNHIYSGGGGGGTFIAKDRTPLCVAGGGGAFTYSSYSTNGNGFAKLTLLIIPVSTPNKHASCSHCKSPIVWTLYALFLSK